MHQQSVCPTLRVMAKKPSKGTLDRPMQIRVSDDLFATFERAAELDGRNVSNWARDRLLRAARSELAAAGEQPSGEKGGARKSARGEDRR